MKKFFEILLWYYQEKHRIKEHYEAYKAELYMFRLNAYKEFQREQIMMQKQSQQKEKP